MEILSSVKKSVEVAGSCNLCSRVKLLAQRDDSYKITYPYEKVNEVTSADGGFVINICDDCLNELRKIK